MTRLIGAVRRYPATQGLKHGMLFGAGRRALGGAALVLRAWRPSPAVRRAAPATLQPTPLGMYLVVGCWLAVSEE